MTYELIFAAAALGLVLLTLFLFARSLFRGGEGTDAALAELRLDYAALTARREAGKISEADFAREEEDLCLRVIDETSKPEREDEERFPSATILALIVLIPAMTAGLYLWYGDYSSLDQEAADQIAAMREQAASQKDYGESIATLEGAVKKNADNLEAWEILADHYNTTGNFAQAQIAYENVVRLAPQNAPAWAELADVSVAVQEGALTGRVGEAARKALELDPWSQKALIIAGAVAFDEEKFGEAAMLFRRLRDQFPVGDEVYEALTANINSALELGGLKEIPKDPVGPKPATDMTRALQQMGGGARLGDAPAQGFPVPEEKPFGLMGKDLPK